MAELPNSKAMINALISNVSPKSIQDFIRQQNRSFIPYPIDTAQQTTKLGEIEFADTDRLLVFSCRVDGELHTRSSRKMQFEIAKQALKDDFKDGAVFVFYDDGGRFRFSFIRRNYGDKEQKYSNWKRFTYFVEPNAQTNRTFIERVGGCKFESLDAIQLAFSVEQLTKDFYKELSDWYFWAIKNVTFPNDVNDDTDDIKYNSENIIRLITRLIFAWFLRQKDLIKPELFDTAALAEILNHFDAESETQNNYYRAILQNLFFATLNQEIDKRGFAADKGFLQNKSTNNVKNLYRYENEFQKDTAQIMELFNKVPFLNGGLFECLDCKQKDEKLYDWDGFSRNPKRQANIPNILFFGRESKVDLSGEYNDRKMKAVKVSGIIEILKRYNFTVEENTPVEVEVALDPELLGKVFENLLGAFNPETQETARKQTGSFYTPREIVNYMVDESLIAYFKTKVPEVEEETLRNLLGYDEVEIELTDIQCALLIQAIFNCKILDPATGSGAFPMGFLQQMVHILRKLDPNNSHWNNVVMAQAMKDFETAGELSDDEKEDLLAEIEHSFDDNVNYPDYARKLYLIENCIYGVDIQSIAVQICKLRFFISLVCEQNHSEDAADNFGIRPLPNLETKFVTANTLIGIEKNEEDMVLFKQQKILKLVEKLKQVRHRQFLVTNAQQKKELRDKDETLRHEIVTEVQTLYVKRADDDIFRLKMQLKQSEKELENLNKQADVIQNSVELTLFGSGKTKTINVTENRRIELKALITKLNKQITEGSKYTRLESVVQLAQQLTSWNPYDQNASSPFFDPEWMFGMKEGFDIVSGNPPYVSAPSMVNNNPEGRQKIINSNQFKTLFQKWDLYIPFMELGLQFLLENGIFTMIVPYPVTNQTYGKKLRELIVDKYKLIEIVDLNGTKVFENATVSNCIPFISKSNSTQKCFVSHINENKEIKRVFCQYLSDLVQDKNTAIWNLSIKQNDSNRHSDMNILGDFCYISVGMVLNADEKKAKGEFSKDDLISETYDTLHNRKYIEAKDIEKFRVKKIRYLEYNSPRCPDKLRRQTFRELYESPKLMFNRLGNLMVYLDLDTKFLHSDSMYSAVLWKDLKGIENKSISASVKRYSKHSRNEMESFSNKIELHYLLGILNSKYASVLLTNLRGGDYHIYPEHIRNLPIPFAKIESQLKVLEIVDKIIELKQSNISTNLIEIQLDNIVYKLYHLSYKAVKVIDPEIESKISEEEYNLIEIE